MLVICPSIIGNMSLYQDVSFLDESRTHHCVFSEHVLIFVTCSGTNKDEERIHRFKPGKYLSYMIYKGTSRLISFGLGLLGIEVT